MTVVPQSTPSAPAALGPYSPAVRAGDWLVLSGQVGIDPATGRLVDGGAGEQAGRIMANVAAILADCGAALASVAKVTIFLTDLDDFQRVNERYAAALGDHRPARSTVQVAALPGGATVEIEVWAYVPSR
jgi:2-iminobutanoate/2-iminopropanoate deaminase